MEEAGVPIASIIFLAVVYMCCFCCIGCCLKLCRKRKQSDKQNEIHTEAAEVDDSNEDNKQTVIIETPEHKIPKDKMYIEEY